MRLLLRVLTFLLIVFVLGSLALWIFLASWVPTKGKALLIDTLEREAPIHVELESMRYHLFKGFVLQNLNVYYRDVPDPWLSSPTMSVHIGWTALALQQQVAFRAHAPVTSPCETEVSLTGRYHLRTHSLTCHLRTTDLAIERIAPPLNQHIPAPLRGGTLRVTLHITRRADELPTIDARIIGTALQWRTADWQMTGDLTMDGQAIPPQDTTTSWKIRTALEWRNGRVDGLPHIHTITDVEGKALWSEDMLTIRSLTGTALGARWNLEGTLSSLTQPRLDVLLTSRLDLGPLSAGLSAFKGQWHVAGPAEIRAVCRGPLQPTTMLDCLAKVDVHGATLTGAALTQPITNMTGRIEYDALTQRLSLASLRGRIQDNELMAHGDIALAPSPSFSLGVQGRVSLESIEEWLPANTPLRELTGHAVLDVHVDGPLSAPRYLGEVNLEEVHAQLATLPYTIDRLSGSLSLSPEQIRLHPCTLQVNDQPIHVTATLSRDATPRLVATVTLPYGELLLRSRLNPHTITVEEAVFSFPESELRMKGTYSLNKAQPSALTILGQVELSQLSQLPIPALSVLKSWRLMGPATLDGQLDGQLSDWPSLTMHGRVRSARMSLREIPIEQLMLDVEQQNRTLRLHISQALMAGGKLVGEATVEHRDHTHDYLAQADLVGLQLANLTEVIPTWKNRSVTGTASAHALLSGTWETRASWRGEGWVNATGEHLGNVPLLDKVFQGLFGILADRLGLDMLRQAEINQASVQWRLSQERIRTDDLRLAGIAGTEPVAIYAKGSVGLDQTLDFVIEPEFTEGLVLEAPSTSAVASTVLKAAGQLDRFRRLVGRHRLTGTLKQPDYHFELSMQETLKQLAPVPGDLLRGLFDAIRQ